MPLLNFVIDFSLLKPLERSRLLYHQGHAVGDGLFVRAYFAGRIGGSGAGRVHEILAVKVGRGWANKLEMGDWSDYA